MTVGAWEAVMVALVAGFLIYGIGYAVGHWEKKH